MTKNEIKEVLLKSVGNPTSGVVKEATEVQAQALYEALNPTPKAEKPKKETASIEPEETR